MNTVRRAAVTLAVGLVGVGAPLALMASPASAGCDVAQNPYGCTPSGTSAITSGSSYTPGGSVQAIAATNTSSALAFTGTDVAGMVGVAVVLLGAGGVLVVRNRRQSATVPVERD